MREKPDQLITEIARDQFGFFHRNQAIAAGLSDNDIAFRVVQGRLERELPRVYAIAGNPSSWMGDLMAVTLWAGRGSAVAGRGAAQLLGFDGFSGSIVEVATVSRLDRRALKLRTGRHVIVHRVDDRLLNEISAVGAIPVTSVRRTLIDLTGQKDSRCENALDFALRNKMTTAGSVWLLLEQDWMRGRRGVRIMRNLLVDRSDQAPTDSELELRARKLIDRAGLPRPQHQYPIELPNRTIKVDLAYPAQRLVVELDSYSWHMDRGAFERDRERDIELQALSWTVFRFTWAMLRYEPHRVVELIRTHLAKHASSVGS
ncbi:MAG: DUF559 domain-containing protein [Actinomycetota bacterium]